MIVGIGVDLVHVDRIQRAIQKNERFLLRVFSPAERDYCQAGAAPFERYAARYAAKEAFLKVCGRGITACPLKDIEVVKAASGRPSYRLGPGAEKLAKESGIDRLHLTLTHDQGRALAWAIGESR